MLGVLQGSLTGIQKQLDEIERKASHSRAIVHNQLEDIRLEAAETRRRVESVETAIEKEVRPVVRSVVDWRSRAAGGLLVLGVIGAALTAILWALWELILEGWRSTTNNGDR